VKKLLVCIPVYNENQDIKKNIPILLNFMKERMSKYDWNVLICNNGSTDNTLDVSEQLTRENERLRVANITEKGRGFALKTVWLENKADIYSYMDIDLSTNLDNFPDLISAFDEGYQIAIGSRLLPYSKIKRSFKREILSRGYNLLIKLLFWNRFSDAQCGFKAISSEVRSVVVPFIQNRNWFFDTELLLLSERKGYKIKEIPVGWIEDMGSKVKIFRTIYEDIAGLIRLRLSKTNWEIKIERI